MTAMVYLTSYILIILTTFSLQTSNDVRRRLGAPVTEIYRPDPSISVKVDYDDQGQICMLRINGKQSGVIRRMVTDDMTKLAEQLVPVKSRGRLLGIQGIPPAMNCCDSHVTRYEKVIQYSWSRHGSDYMFRYEYVGRECASGQPEKTDVTR